MFLKSFAYARQRHSRQTHGTTEDIILVVLCRLVNRENSAAAEMFLRCYLNVLHNKYTTADRKVQTVPWICQAGGTIAFKNCPRFAYVQFQCVGLGARAFIRNSPNIFSLQLEKRKQTPGIILYRYIQERRKMTMTATD